MICKRQTKNGCDPWMKGRRSLCVLRTIRVEPGKRGGAKCKQFISYLAKVSLVSLSVHLPWPMTEDTEQACSYPETQARGRVDSNYSSYRWASGNSYCPQGKALHCCQHRWLVSSTQMQETSQPSVSSWLEAEARKQTGTLKHCSSA